MGKVKRNMPCPCGSGLKYKKCCGNTKAEFPAVVVQELKQIQKDVMEFAFTEHKRTIDQFLNQYSFLADLDESAQKICVFNLGVWGVFSQPLAEGALTIFEDYLRQRALPSSDRKRKKLFNPGSIWIRLCCRSSKSPMVRFVLKMRSQIKKSRSK